MSDVIRRTLLTLKDVEGTRGSFVLNGDGVLLAMEMPAFADPTMFADLGPRIERLAESFTALGEELESCLLRFSDHLLSIKWFAKGGALCILTESSVNLPALRMAMNLAHRRLAGEIAAAPPLVPTPAPAPAAAAAPSVNGTAPGAKPAAEQAEQKTVRFYRGHPVD
ncbi:MAG TPA: hypothetical protein VGK20_00190 [Candidatus Binatia bacterium]|jgi:predicted regulator of Ras-like GTPase activity (Roadblock/LC7/MglB family)